MKKLIILFFFFIYTDYVFSLENQKELNAISINLELDKAEREVKRKNVRVKKLEVYFKKIKEYRAWAVTCVSSDEKNILEVTKKSKGLGEKVKGESLTVVKKRTDLKKQESSLKKSLATCNVILLRSEELTNKINFVQQSLLAEKLLTKGPSFFYLISKNWDNPTLWTDALKTFVLEHSGLLDIQFLNIAILIVLVLFIFYISKLYSTKLSFWRSTQSPKPLLASQLLCALVVTAERYIKYTPTFLTAVLFFNIIDFDVTPKPFIVIVLNGLAIVTVLNIITHFFLNSSLSIYKYEPETKSNAVNLVHRLKVLTFIIFFGYLLFTTIFFHEMPEAIALMSRGIYGTIFVLNIVWVVWLLGHFHKFGNNLIVKLALTLIFVVALIAEWLGYRNLSIYIVEVIISTLFLLGSYSILSKLISEFIDSLDKGSIPSTLVIRNWLGIREDQSVPGLFWVRLIITLLMWIGFISLIIVIWKIPDTYTDSLLIKIIEGIKIGSFKLVPLQIFEALVVLSFILFINSWFKRRLEKYWLPKTNMTRSVRESMATISGYVGILIAFIFALSFIGMDFSKLALVAGALSVGIGFGLQNVVNNFISGLILLFERPIKTGDWIIVGAIEGHVKKISIRSTHIQTFDRADVIVPNSEIISGTVTNWMLRDHSGRIKLPVGIAYGSDTDLVRDSLLKVANDHSEVIKGNSVISDPKVMFLSFGDSSLDFELRCHVYNINNRLSIISDLNFAIDKIFRENNISIPFPQRDIHILKEPKED